MCSRTLLASWATLSLGANRNDSRPDRLRWGVCAAVPGAQLVCIGQVACTAHQKTLRALASCGLLGLQRGPGAVRGFLISCS